MGQPGLGRDVGEGAIAVVAEEHVAAARARHVQVRLAVVVVVHPGRGHADAVAQRHAGLGGDLLEGAVPLVAVQGIRVQLVAEVNIVQAVAVEVADRNAAAVVVEVDLERLALLVGEEAHPPRQPHFRGALAGQLGSRILRRIGLMPSPVGAPAGDRDGKGRGRASRDQEGSGSGRQTHLSAPQGQVAPGCLSGATTPVALPVCGSIGAWGVEGVRSQMQLDQDRARRWRVLSAVAVRAHCRRGTSGVGARPGFLLCSTRKLHKGT
jgi:hypothetical protein